MHRKLVPLVGALALLSSTTPCAILYAQGGEAQKSGRTVPNGSWISEPWTGEDRPYQAVRQAIDKAVRSGQSPEALLDRYRAQAAKQPQDPQAQFGWGYAAYWAITAKPGYPGEVRRARAARAPAPSPRAYQYARLRFLLEAGWSPAIPPKELQGVGERLLRRNPNDAAVKYLMVELLSWSRTPQDQERALKYAREMVQAAPKNPAYHASLGGVYVQRWSKGKREGDADRAIAAYREYLRLAPKNDPWRERAETYIKVLQRQSAEQRRGSP